MHERQKKIGPVLFQIVEAPEAFVSLEPFKLDIFMEYTADYEECRDFMCGEGTLSDLFSECRLGLAVCERSCRLAV